MKKSKLKNKIAVQNKKKVIIEIPDDLTPEQEIFEIAKQLHSRKTLGTNSSTTKLIGNGSGIKLKHLETQIVIKRKSKEKAFQCPVCETFFEKKLGCRYYHNFGGFIQSKIACSVPCTDLIISLNPNRISKKKSDIKISCLYNQYR